MTILLIIATLYLLVGLYIAVILIGDLIALTGSGQKNWTDWVALSAIFLALTIGWLPIFATIGR